MGLVAPLRSLVLTAILISTTWRLAEHPTLVSSGSTPKLIWLPPEPYLLCPVPSTISYPKGKPLRNPLVQPARYAPRALPLDENLDLAELLTGLSFRRQLFSRYSAFDLGAGGYGCGYLFRGGKLHKFSRPVG